MARKVSAFTVEIGQAQRLELAVGEDREFRLTFVEPASSPSPGPIDLSGAQKLQLNLERADGSLLARITGAYLGAGVASFPVAASASEGEAPQAGRCDAFWIDGAGNREQLLRLSSLALLQGVS